MAKVDEAASNSEWRRWGEIDPFYGVASWPGRQREGANPWTPDEFYALGESDWADFRGRWIRYGVDFGTVVEIGCGAGRLTKHMSVDFAHVIGVDVSEGMLAVARAHLPEPNVDLRRGDGITLPVETAAADAVFSAHVFQHFDTLELARANFAELARVLRADGTLMVHLPVLLPPGGLPGYLLALSVRRRLS